MSMPDSKGALITWVGDQDLADLNPNRPRPDGPIAVLLRERGFITLHYLYTSGPGDNDRAGRVDQFITKLKSEFRGLEKTHPHPAGNLAPDHHNSIYDFVAPIWEKLCRTEERPAINVTSGTPAMAAVMLYLGRLKGADLFSTRSSQYAQDGKRVLPVNWNFGPAMRRTDDDRGTEIHGLPAHEQRDLRHKIAPTRVSVLLQGETGTGKTFLAQRIHQWSGREGKGSFEERNCAAISTDSNSFVSELFGHVKGAYTGAVGDRQGAFELAKKGTLFLDEVGELTLDQQSRLLSVVEGEKGQFMPLGADKPKTCDNVRLIVATNKDLVEEVRAGRFRSDLYYRLAEYTAHLQPTREWGRADREALLEDFLHRLGREFGQPKTLGDAAREYLLAYHWPGNIRQMHHLLKRVYLLSEGGELDHERVRVELEQPTPASVSTPAGQGLWEDRPLDEAVALLRLTRVERALDDCGGENVQGAKTKAAGILGIKNLQTLNNYLKNGRDLRKKDRTS